MSIGGRIYLYLDFRANKYLFLFSFGGYDDDNLTTTFHTTHDELPKTLSRTIIPVPTCTQFYDDLVWVNPVVNFIWNSPESRRNDRPTLQLS